MCVVIWIGTVRQIEFSSLLGNTGVLWVVSWCTRGTNREAAREHRTGARIGGREGDRGDSLSSNDFSNLTNSQSPTPELEYTRDGASEYVYWKFTCLNELGVRKESIKFEGKKGREPYMRMCWCGGIKIWAWSCGGVNIFVQQGERV